MARNWKNIHLDFTKALQREWEQHHFSYWETKEWIDIGLTPADAPLANWLRDIKQLDAEWVLNYGDSEQLRKEYLESKDKPSIYASLKGYFLGTKPTTSNSETATEEESDQETNSEISETESNFSTETVKFNPPTFSSANSNNFAHEIPKSEKQPPKLNNNKKKVLVIIGLLVIAGIIIANWNDY